MTKNLPYSEETEVEQPDASKTKPPQAKGKKKHTAKKVVAAGRGKLASAKKKCQKAQKTEETDGKTSPQERPLESDQVLSLQSGAPKQPKPRVAKRKPKSKRVKKRDLSEDIKAQLKEVFNNLSQIYFSFE